MSEFKREERYIVVKLKHLAGLQVAPLRNFLRENRVPTLDCVVVEQDWPEYEKVWRSIERRMTGQPAEDFDRVTAERDAALGREAALARELEAESQGADRAAESLMEWRRDYLDLQQRLTAADERADVLETALRNLKAAWASSPMSITAPEYQGARDALDGIALKQAEGGGDEA